MGRLAIFIDGAYIDFTLRGEFGGARIDYGRMVTELTPPGDDLLRAYYYTCPPHQSEVATQEERERQRTFDRFRYALDRIPRFEVRLGKLAKRVDPSGAVRFEQKRVDILLGIDVVRLASKQQITGLVLVAGDSDFVPALQVAKDEGVLCRLFHGENPHNELRQAADEHERMDQGFIDRVRRP